MTPAIWICACQLCPVCGHFDNDPEFAHPEDGLASCFRCGREWWAAVGPFMDGRHTISKPDAEMWDRLDNAAMDSPADRIPGGQE